MKSVLYRSETDKMLGGVCGGIGNYLGIDSTFVRLFFALLFFGSGIGLLAYLVLWIVMPSETASFAGTTWEENFKDSAENFGERAQSMGKNFQQAMRSPHPQAGMIVGIALIALGGLLFVENLGISWLNWLSFDKLWPLLLIVGGGALLLRHTQEF